MLIKDSVSLEALREQIEIVRARMQQLGNEKGYADTEVLNASIELTIYWMSINGGPLVLYGLILIDRLDCS